MEETFLLDDSLALLGGLLAVIVIFILLMIILNCIGLWKVFKKANKPGWASIVPFYGDWILVEIAGLHWIYFVFLIFSFSITIEHEGISLMVDLLSMYASFVCFYNLSKRFGKGVGLAILLFFFSPIVLLYLGFSKNCKYDSSIPVLEHGFFGKVKADNVNTDNTNTDADVINQIENNDNSIFCANCGSKVDNFSRFCHNCGKEITK